MKENEDIGSSLFSNSCPLLYVPRLRRRGNQLLFYPPPEPSHPFLLSKDLLIEPKARRFLLKTSIEKIQKNLMENHGKFPKISSRALHYIATKVHVKYPPYFSQFFVLDLGSILRIVRLLRFPLHVRSFPYLHKNLFPFVCYTLDSKSLSHFYCTFCISIPQS